MPLRDKNPRAVTKMEFGIPADVCLVQTMQVSHDLVDLRMLPQGQARGKPGSSVTHREIRRRHSFELLNFCEKRVHGSHIL